MRTFAEIGPGGVVLRVILADSLDVCLEVSGPGQWEETVEGHGTERYAGVGMVFVPSDPRRFLFPSEVV